MTKPLKYSILLVVISIFLILWWRESLKDKEELHNLRGKVIFSVGRDDLYVLNLANQKHSKIELKKFDIYFPAYPCWLPPGDQIVFSNYRDNRGVVTVYDLEKQSIKEYPEINLDCSFISVSPTGEDIAFLGKPIGSDNEHLKLYTLSLNNRKVSLATTTVVGPYKPTWSPDGRKIAFTSVDNNIFVLNNGNLSMIIRNGVAPIWSPKGNDILYRANYFVYLFDLYSKDKRLIVANLGFDDVKDYAWSPDGKYVIYKRFTESSSPLAVKDPLTNTKKNLQKFGNVKGLCWKY